MDQMKSYKEILSRIEELVSKIEKADLSLDELFEMERLTAKLHERSIILRYKAFENKLGVTKAVVVEEPEISLPEEEIKEPEVTKTPEPISEEESDDVEFALFEEESEEIDMSFEEPEEEKTVEPIQEIQEEKVEEPSVTRAESSTSSSFSFIDKFQTEDNSLSNQFAASKLETLIGAFSLNEKLRYINDLFDGSSELFSDAIKSLDTKSSFNDASDLLSDLAKQHEWDPEEESVSEFMIFIRRRYA